jgi:hypothetical protein
LLLALSVLSACSTPIRTTPAPIKDPVAQLVSALSGSYSSQRQAEADPSYFDLRLHLQPIWSQREGEHWLYVEQALGQDPDRPFRQRIYRMQTSAADTVVAHIYALPGDALQFAGAHKHPDLLNWVQPAQLIELAGCAIYFTSDGTDRYNGSTRGDGCAAEARAALFTRTRLVLWRGVLSIWERGFDAQSTQVWGAVSGPYEYERIET